MKLFLSTFFLFILHNSISAEVVKQPPLITPIDTVYVEYYIGNGCPQCARIHPYILSIQNKYPQVVIKEYEIYDNRKNLLQLQKRFRELDISFKYQCIPAVFIGDECFTGYKEIKKELELSIKKKLTISSK